MFQGVVQGVGFRPFVHALALRHGLVGFVANDAAGLVIEVQGQTEQVAAFAAAVEARPPAPACITAVRMTSVPLQADQTFRIAASTDAGGWSSFPAPDLGMCARCSAELLTAADRRHQHPFISCSECGPRFTITRTLPFDRATTTMAGFEMCAACWGEYDDSTDRRFHAQTLACLDCGPRLRLVRAGQVDLLDREALAAARLMLQQGLILAVKGIGGFHLACRAPDLEAVRRLRQRKQRGAKPLAVLVGSLEEIRGYARISPAEAELLASPARPIVLLAVKGSGAALAALVAPGLDVVGFMLPYAPLHALLLEGTPLVLTSGNLADEPIATANDEACRRLANVADGFLVHDREIVQSCDDSVVRVCAETPLLLRRARGLAPQPMRLPRSVPSILAVGGEMKSAFGISRGDQAFLSQHLGELGQVETLAALEQTVDHFLRLLHCMPQLVVCDLHPGYVSSQWAQNWARQRGLPCVAVPHHQAHLAALLLDAEVEPGTPVLGVCFDGTGYGKGGQIWGGEFISSESAGMRRVGHLHQVPLPGGDAAIHFPYRAALAHLWAAGLAWDDDLPCVRAATEQERRHLLWQLERQVGCVPTSSMGRLFDAAAAMLGVCAVSTYEAQAAMELEAMAELGPDATRALDEFGCRFAVQTSADNPIQLDPGPLWAGLRAGLRAGVPVPTLAGCFHLAVANAIGEVAEHGLQRISTSTIGLTGGVFQNAKLAALVQTQFRARGWRVLTHRQVPPNDGGLALGQLGLAAGLIPGGSAWA
ncbi:MAG TPA: carbamoyltransferase HypF [Gemmatales bacterium]|nr:carbamoyltransferase HypF [Gemmatales bacterium]